MNILIKILALLMALEGALALFLPTTVNSATQEFTETPDAEKRLIGGFFLLIGLILLIIADKSTLELKRHLFISIYATFIGLYGLLLVILPKAGASFLAWIYAERGPTSLIGGILLAAGLSFFFLL